MAVAAQVKRVPFDGLSREGGSLFLVFPLVTGERHPFADDRPTRAMLGSHCEFSNRESLERQFAGRHAIDGWTSRNPCEAAISQIASSQKLKLDGLNFCRKINAVAATMTPKSESQAAMAIRWPVLLKKARRAATASFFPNLAIVSRDV
jgi:hypothetical protein